ncbi:MAG: radical SAM protein [Nitrospirae bacterium]|nr:radical SAM protein [Nitrospirota bacterium]
MRYFLSADCALKQIEKPHVYHIKKDELYELDNESFQILKKCADKNGCTLSDKDFIDYCLEEEILTKDMISVNRPTLIKSPVPSLRYLELQITERCNLRCRHCFINENKAKELSAIEVKKILDEFEEMQGLRVMLTGGEPLLHSRLVEINEMLPAYSVRKVLFTNGLLLTKKNLKTLNVDEIQISIDGLEDAHDSLRGKGAFKKAINAARLSAENDLEVSVSTMVHPKNLKDFDEMEQMFRDIGIKDWTVDVPCISGRLKENKEFQISPEMAGEYLRYGYGKGLHLGKSGFGCGLHLMSVMADGNVAKCSFYADRAIGTDKEGLRKCWKRIKPIKLAELKCDCEYCEYIEQCRGGCRYRAELSENHLGKDLYRCAFYA